ncbi:MAG: spore cortex biosynthesis protein YabQ [Ruminococcus sp.]|uniref:spore cortex biosynthesis protein YabQ n=1 Tax=Ruminococcus sp. TaxID=41978 RepID=UPI0025DE1A11|nr:spore cortex biosynthesis protein YabQ [Ruminococcus sp.]MBR5682873.1 spore cortex biosynthesis protein YabQ [Ruminococcus sp.]
MRIVPETYFAVSEELRLFGLSCAMGAVVGAAFDAVRAIRLILPHNRFLVAVEDAVFLLLYSMALTAFAAAAARGDLRAYFVIGNILGFLVYFVTLGSIVMKTLRKLFLTIGTCFGLILRPVRLIFAPLYKKVNVKFVRNLQIVVKRFKKIKIVLLKRPSMLYNKMENKKRKNVKNVVEKNET